MLSINYRQQISEYIKNAGNRKVYISELAEELLIDFDLIEEIMKEFECTKEISFKIINENH